MDNIVFTQFCKEQIILANNGMKFVLKGYAFYSDKLENLDLLQINDLKKENLILNEFSNSTELYNSLFGLTYIPSLEYNLINQDTNEFISNLGTYEIPLNKGLFKNLPKTIKYILLFGEIVDETPNYIIDKRKIYLAGIIQLPNEIIIDEENVFIPEKYIFQLSFTNSTIPDEVYVDIEKDFDDLMVNESLNNINSIKLNDNFTLTPDENNNNYDEEIKIINGNIPNTTKFFPGNLSIFEDNYEINTPWNTKPKVFIGTNENEIPLQLSYNSDNGLKSFSFQYNPNHKFFSVNNDEGLDYIQADIFPENIEQENKICIKTRIKPKNYTFDYKLTSSCKSYLRMNTYDSVYQSDSNYIFENNCHNNSRIKCKQSVIILFK